MSAIDHEKIMKSMFETFECVFKDYEKSKNPNDPVNEENSSLRKLALLDDSESVLIWQAFLSTYFQNPSTLCYRPSINLGAIPSNSSVGYFRNYVTKRIEQKNPYYKNVEQIKNGKMEGMCAVGYHGSNIFGEWINAYVSEEKNGLIDYYFKFMLNTGILARISRIVTSDRLYAYYKQINKSENKTDLFCSFIYDETLEDGIIREEPKEIIANANHFVIKYSKKFIKDILLDYDDKTKTKTDVNDSDMLDTVIESKKKLNRYLEGYFDYVLSHNKNIENQIKDILSLKYEGKKDKVQEDDIINFLGMMQFLIAFTTISDIKEFHFYFPTAIRETDISELHVEIPEMFFMFFDKIDKKDLKFLDLAYEEFVIRYNDIVAKLLEKVREKFVDLQGTQSSKELNKSSNNISEFHKSDLPFVRYLENKFLGKTTLVNHILAAGMMGKKFVSETRIENKDIQYSFILSNRENMEVIQRKYGRNPYISLSFNDEKIKFNSTNEQNQIDFTDLDEKRLTIGIETKRDEESIRITKLEDESLYKSIGLLKGHYTLIDKPSRIIALVPDDRKNSTVKLFSVLDLNLSKLGLLEEQTNSSEVLQKLTEKFDNSEEDKMRKEVYGISVSKDGSQVIHEGKIIGSYNGQTLEWEEHPKLQDVLQETIARIMGTISPDISTIIADVIQRISNSHSYGATIVLGNKSELKKFTSSSFLIEQFSDKEIIPEYDPAIPPSEIIKQRAIGNLFDLAIMDGATLIDVATLECRGREVLQPMMPSDTSKPFHFSLKIESLDPNWQAAAKYYSVGTRHLSALGLALCTNNSLIFVISSTGTITTLYRGKNGKVRGYSIEELQKENKKNHPKNSVRNK